jgi:hypothetical protein
MDDTEARQLGEATYRKLRSHIDATYPPGHLVALWEGKIVADGATYREVNTILHQMGNDSPHVMLVRAGEDYDKMTIILALESHP